VKCGLACLAAFVASIGGIGHAQQVAASSSTPATQAGSPAHGAVEAANYQIGIKDSLAIDVFDVPTLSQTVEVDHTGSINLPLIGQVQAAGLTTNQLSQAIAAALSAKYMKDPIVTVSVKDAASKKVTVDGSVVQPGMYEIAPGTTLTQAVALAHGADQVADVHHVAIIRGQGAARTISVFDLDDIRDGKAADPSINPDDTVVVDTSGTRKFVRDFGSVISVLGFLHP
jgi:polysaccharide export outer membrane protein